MPQSSPDRSTHLSPSLSPLGKATPYVSEYDPSQLYPIPRKMARDGVGMPTPLPFSGVDIWTGYEFSWLNLKGKPEIALAEFYFPCESPNLVESKSLKLYLNSFNNSRFASLDAIKDLLERDLSTAALYPVAVRLISSSQFGQQSITQFCGTCLDALDIETEVYRVEPGFLRAADQAVEETLYSNLLKSNCLVTGQPDWGELSVHYVGPQIDHAGLLKYIVSYREHAGFGEQCVERIFLDILAHCRPQKLTVYARYTRRGGLDINPFRSNFESAPLNIRHARQ